MCCIGIQSRAPPAPQRLLLSLVKTIQGLVSKADASKSGYSQLLCKNVCYTAQPVTNLAVQSDTDIDVAGGAKQRGGKNRNPHTLLLSTHKVVMSDLL